MNLTSDVQLWELVLPFEGGKVTGDILRSWFRDLIETGYIWKLPEYYLENATTLLEGGYIDTTKINKGWN